MSAIPSTSQSDRITKGSANVPPFQLDGATFPSGSTQQSAASIDPWKQFSDTRSYGSTPPEWNPMGNRSDSSDQTVSRGFSSNYGEYRNPLEISPPSSEWFSIDRSQPAVQSGGWLSSAAPSSRSGPNNNRSDLRYPESATSNPPANYSSNRSSNWMNSSPVLGSMDSFSGGGLGSYDNARYEQSSLGAQTGSNSGVFQYHIAAPQKQQLQRPHHNNGQSTLQQHQPHGGRNGPNGHNFSYNI